MGRGCGDDEGVAHPARAQPPRPRWRPAGRTPSPLNERGRLGAAETTAGWHTGAVGGAPMPRGGGTRAAGGGRASGGRASGGSASGRVEEARSECLRGVPACTGSLGGVTARGGAQPRGRGSQGGGGGGGPARQRICGGGETPRGPRVWRKSLGTEAHARAPAAPQRAAAHEAPRQLPPLGGRRFPPPPESGVQREDRWIPFVFRHQKGGGVSGRA